jgi:sporulation protein YlmC with PRC-barrel domain
VKRDAPLKLLSEVRDLQIVDSEGRNCGICDDVELEESENGQLIVKAMIVGPGAYRYRLPMWLLRLAQALAGRSMTRVPWQAVEKVSGRIFLNRPAQSLGLGRMDDRLSQYLRQVPSA